MLKCEMKIYLNEIEIYYMCELYKNLWRNRQYFYVSKVFGLTKRKVMIFN